MRTEHHIAAELLRTPYEKLDPRARHVARHVIERTHIARDLSTEPVADTTPGQRAADAVARFGGSWVFIGLFLSTLVVWIVLNSLVLVKLGRSFDPYPYILLNLVLSMLAAIQAPIILMSQNRQSQKDRRDAEHDYEVNLKAELEIMLLHEKMDSLKNAQWSELLSLQAKQLDLLEALANQRTDQPKPPVLGHRQGSGANARRSR